MAIQEFYKGSLSVKDPEIFELLLGMMAIVRL